MKVILVSFFSILVSMLVIDSVWLGSMLKRFYSPQIGHLFGDSMKLAPAAIFYLLYAVGVYFFVVGPELRAESNYLHTLFLGMFFGLITYATYDLTNQVTLKNWPWIVTIVDLAWGSILVGLVSVISTYITRLFLGSPFN